MLKANDTGSTRSPLVQAYIDVAALKQNYRYLRQLSENTNAGGKTLAVIKADAYGHGLIPIARALQEADGFAVARINEALQLRQAGVSNKIIILEGVFCREDLLLALQHNLELVVHQQQQLKLLESVSEALIKDKCICWVKVNTGMNRLGFSLDEMPLVKSFFEKNTWVQPQVLMTHLANADSGLSNDILSALQAFEKFKIFLPDTRQYSIPNSAALIAFPECRSAWNRPGISLYGSSLLNKTEPALQPVMSLQAEVIAIHKVQAGASVGYGSIWTASQDTEIAVVGVGYGDGYPRHARNGAPVIIGGKEYPLAGRVSMDMITVELGKAHSVTVGDKVLLWGRDDGGAVLSVDRVADYADTISYELFCRLTSRVQRTYING